jgi:hypothetical protein
MDDRLPRFQPILPGGSVAGVSAEGAEWLESDGQWVACPVTSILAVRYGTEQQRSSCSLAFPQFTDKL